MDTERYGIGGNNPPPDLKIGEALREELRDNNHAMEERRDELLAGAGEVDADHAGHARAVRHQPADDARGTADVEHGPVGRR